MLNLALIRIDERLIHGQVIASWSKHISANRIIIVDEATAEDEFMSKVLKMAAPSGIKIDIYGLEKAVEVLGGEADPNQRIILLVKSPLTILKLLEKGVELKEINIGNMGASSGRKPITKNVAITAEEKEVFQKILEKNVKLYLRMLPSDSNIDMSKYL